MRGNQRTPSESLQPHPFVFVGAIDGFMCRNRSVYVWRRPPPQKRRWGCSANPHEKADVCIWPVTSSVSLALDNAVPNQLNLGGGLSVNGALSVSNNLSVLGSITSVGNAPQATVYTTGSGTYTVPTNARWIHIRMIGGGGGGSTYNTAGVAGGNTTFGSYTAGGGGAGSAGSSGGTASGSPLIGIQGAAGTSNQISAAAYPSGWGGVSPFGGGATPNSTGYGGSNAAANSGSGGCGGNTAAGTTTYPGWGGGAGAYVEHIFTTLAASYSYGVGAGGAGGTTATSGYTNGTSGGSGIIIVMAYF